MRQHLRTLQEKLAGTTLPGMEELINVAKPYKELRDLLHVAADEARSTCCWLVGSTRSGKMTLLRKVLHDSGVQWKVVTLTPEQCFTPNGSQTSVAGIASLYDQIFDGGESQYLTTSQKLDRILATIEAPNEQPLLLHLQRFTRLDRDQPKLIYALLDAFERSLGHPSCIVATDVDVVYLFQRSLAELFSSYMYAYRKGRHIVSI